MSYSLGLLVAPSFVAMKAAVKQQFERMGSYGASQKREYDAASAHICAALDMCTGPLEVGYGVALEANGHKSDGTAGGIRVEIRTVQLASEPVPVSMSEPKIESPVEDEPMSP